MSASSPAILILGPTAGGKTALAIEVAQRINGGGECGGECVSADSMQVYRGMDIGTAKARPEEWRGVLHHLIDIVEPDDDSFNVGRWLELCRDAVADIRGRERTPIIVGGTNLYVQMLLGGVADDLPEPDDELRTSLNAQSPEELRAHLLRVDPEAAERIHFNDRKRTIRAIEVFEQTGRPLSAMQKQWTGPPTPVGGTHTSALAGAHADSVPPTGVGGLSHTFIIGLDMPVETINRRINARVKSMIELGLVDEVRSLHEAKRLGRNAREALGYKQIIEHLEGRVSLDDAIEQIKIRTRRYAKQQRTWLRRFRAWLPSAWLNAGERPTPELAELALAAVEKSRCETET